MRIQYISFSKKEFDDFVCSTFLDYQTIDSFDANIIDLSDGNIWKTKVYTQETIDCIVTLTQLGTVVNNSKKNNIVILLPKDICFVYGPDYSYSTNLSKMIFSFKKILVNCGLFNNDILIEYEKNETLLSDGSRIKSDFYFKCFVRYVSPLTVAEYSEKATTIFDSHNRIIYSFLELTTTDLLLQLLTTLGIKDTSNNIPKWLCDMNILNDEIVKKEINDCEEQIEDASNKIKQNKLVLQDNNYYKEMLTQSGDELVERVYKTLEEILSVDLSSFVDVKEADFIFEKNNVTFIGEIKGINTNVKNENISQVEVHESIYLDHLEEQQLDVPTIKKILVVNHQRAKQLCDREPVNERQIKLAVQKEVLIVETKTLIKLLEKHRLGELDDTSIANLLIKSTGLLSI